jgi:hypothetical protein
MTASSFLVFPRDARLRVGTIALAGLLLLFARRFAQLLHPQVWDEDGRIVQDIVASGFGTLVHPLNGYLVTTPKIIALVALFMPLREFALVSTVLAWAFTIAVLVAISIAPTTLRGGPLLALAALLVPSDPEVFGIPLYTFWWASLLLFVAVMWRPEAGGFWWRVAFILIGGLSSPIVLLVLPVALARAFHLRTRSEAIVSTICLGCALVQSAFISQLPRIAGVPLLARIEHAVHEIPVFIGAYATGNLDPNREVTTPLRLLFTVIPLVLIGLAVWREPRRRLVLIALAYFWLGAFLLSSFRVDPPTIPDPVFAGPRYFFFPYVLESWLLIEIALGGQTKGMRATAASVLMLAAFNVLPTLSRTHDDLDWSGNIARCAASSDAAVAQIPIEYDGIAAHAWTLPLTGYTCRQLGNDGLVGLLLHSPP